MNLIDEEDEFADLSDDLYTSNGETCENSTENDVSGDTPVEQDDEYRYMISYSRRCIEKAFQIKDKETYYGIPSANILGLLSIGKTKAIGWEHVTMKLNVEEMRDISGNAIKEFTVPDSVEELDHDPNADTVFGMNNRHRNFLQSIVIPSSVRVINPCTFAYYKNLKSVTFEGNSGLLVIGYRAFAFCEKLHMVDLSHCSSLETLPDNLFLNSTIHIVKLPVRIRHINPKAFDGADIKWVYIGGDKYSYKEFIGYMIKCNFEPFWIVPDEYEF